ncbi:MAG: DUF255 domain-containing protein [Kiritimatiellae bacterium]|nr:DUF255 domain-containing protein [Kiritimatiellia bacterium]
MHYTKIIHTYFITLLMTPILFASDGFAEPVRNPLPSQEEIAKLPPSGGNVFNRLIHETSPYLLQHARNSVDWYPWGKEAFERAQKEDKPIFMSVGYSSCHWCHVMEHESFEKEDVAKIINEFFVPIKVDREERPDIDEIYMNATQLMTGRGGWPNSVWLTPDKRPWFAGTYFPKQEFIRLLNSLAETWKTKRDAVDQQAQKLTSAIKQASLSQTIDSNVQLSRDVIEKGKSQIVGAFDKKYGGFDGRPKFPPHASLRLLLYELQQQKDPGSRLFIERTLEAMARGGIYDHIGGGFHRYSTDEKWFLPHFEKMLYDNAQLAWVYTEAYRQTKNPFYRHIAQETLEWILRDMTDREGGFYSALDADSEGEEGKYYLWTRKEILNILGAKEGESFCLIYNASDAGNYYEEAPGEQKASNILYLKQPLGEKQDKQFTANRQQLLAVRNKRILPGLDDKVLTSWNGLMIGSFAFAGLHLDEPRYIKAAEKSANFILSTMRTGDRLLRTYRIGQAKLSALLGDYVYFIDGLLNLYEATQNKKWLKESETLVAIVVKHYTSKTGGFWHTPDDHEQHITRVKDPYDEAIPSENAMAARVLARLGKLARKAEYLELAEKTFKAFYAYMQQSPRGAATFLEALAIYHNAIKTKRGGSSIAKIQKHPVTIELFASTQRVAAGSSLNLETRIIIDETYHINSHKPKQEYLIPTSVQLKDNPVAALDVEYPADKIIKIAAFPEDIAVYEGTIAIKGTLTINKDAQLESKTLTVNVRTQACDDKSCLPPATHILNIPLEILSPNEQHSKDRK